MSTPAGWYDDGSGRQRWWDGAQWTENYAPVGSGEEGVTPAYAQAEYSVGMAPAPVGPKLTPTLGFIGLGLAVLGTILACIPNVGTFTTGLVVLLAAFVVSLIAVFKKNTKKWPSIVGIILSIVGGVIGSIVFTTVLLLNLASAVNEHLPTDFPTSTTSEQPSDGPSADASERRPSPEAIGKGYKVMLNAGGYHQFDDDPEFLTCIGEHFYDSDVPDEVLRDLAQGIDNTMGAEKAHAVQVGLDATYECDPSLPRPTDH